MLYPPGINRPTILPNPETYICQAPVQTPFGPLVFACGGDTPPPEPKSQPKK